MLIFDILLHLGRGWCRLLHGKSLLSGGHGLDINFSSNLHWFSHGNWCSGDDHSEWWRHRGEELPFRAIAMDMIAVGRLIIYSCSGLCWLWWTVDCVKAPSNSTNVPGTTSTSEWVSLHSLHHKMGASNWVSSICWRTRAFVNDLMAWILFEIKQVLYRTVAT